MNKLALKVTLECYFGFNYIYASIIAIIVLSLIFLFKSNSLKRHGEKITRKDGFFVLGLTLYFTLLIGVMLLNREVAGSRQINWVPFWSYKKLCLEGKRTLLEQILFNVIAFIPWPILFALVFPKMKKLLWSVGSAFVFSVCIEVTQLVFKLGMFEFDDMFHNTLGALIGYGILILFRKNIRAKRDKFLLE